QSMSTAARTAAQFGLIMSNLQTSRLRNESGNWRAERLEYLQLLEETAKRQASKSLAAWASYYLPNYFTAPSSTFHRWFSTELGTFRERRGVKLNIVAPRG